VGLGAVVRVPRHRPAGPLLAFVALALVANLASVLYGLRGSEPSPLYVLLWHVAAGWLFSYWMRADHLRLGTVDAGWFAMVLWPVVVPRHLIRTRGWKAGLLTFGALILLYLMTYAVALAVFFALRAR
jgi:hypothetical protein